MPPRSAEFAIGGELQPHVFLLLDDFFDLAVFDRFERRDVDLAFGALGPCLFQRRGTQQASNMVGAKRRRGALGHDGYSLLRICPGENGDPIHVRWIFARGNKRSVTSPTLLPPIRQSCAVSPTVHLRRVRCLPRLRQSRTAARDRAAQVQHTLSLPRYVS